MILVSCCKFIIISCNIEIVRTSNAEKGSSSSSTLGSLNNDKEITLWGTGIARREFMHVDDLAKVVVYLLEKKVDKELINIGWGKDISIKELAEIIAKSKSLLLKIKIIVATDKKIP